MKDIATDIASAKRRIAQAKEYLRIEELLQIQPQLEAEVSRADLWDDAAHARKITTEYAQVQDDLSLYDQLNQDTEDLTTLFEMVQEDNDEVIVTEIEDQIMKIDAQLHELELRAMFTGEYDDHDAVCELHSGEGGTDAQDWAEMLLRMYTRWAERRGFDVEIDEISPGQEAGITSATCIIKGRHAYGLLRAEQGTHRLVRISPFNAQGKRQTAFASLSAIPLLEDNEIDLVIDDKDLRIDTFRSSGAGGQHVNVTDSAVRITHLPTGTVTSCQNERSQHQNKDRAMQILKAKLADLAQKEREQEMSQIAGEKTRVGFGTQIRSYVLHPYQQVKDLRTGFEVGNVDGVLDGDLNRFMEAYLRFEQSPSDPN